MQPLISICVPAFNCERWIREAIDSVIEQEVSFAYEVIVVDDGSTDGTGTVLDDYARRCRNIQVIHKQNQGPVAARADAIDAAVGTYLMFLDSDDVLAPGSLGAVAAALEESAPDVLIFGYYEFGAGHRRECLMEGLGELARRNARDEILERFVYTKEANNACFKAVRRSLFDSDWLRRHSDVRVGDDWFVLYVPMTSARSFAYLPLAVYGYRFHGASMTDSFDYGYPATLLVMHDCKMHISHSGTGARLSDDRIGTSTLVELAKAISLIPASPRDESRYFAMLDDLARNAAFEELYQAYGRRLRTLFRLPLALLRRHWYRSILRMKHIASALRRRA